MSNKKDALKDVIAKARELSEIAPADRSEEQNTELKSYMDQGQSLRDEIVRDEKLDDFAGKVADTEPNGAKSAPEIDYAVLGRDGGQPNTPFLVAEKKGWSEATEIWKAKRRDAKWGFEVRYKTDPPNGLTGDVGLSTSEVQSPTGVFNGAGGPTQSAGQFAGTVPAYYYPGIIEPPTRTPLISDLFAQGSTDSNLVRLVKETFTSPDAVSNSVTNTGGHGVTATGEGGTYGAVQLEVSPVDWPVLDIEFCGVAA